MTALVINCIIGGGIFGLPGELTRLLGRASPFAMILAALGMAVILSCFAEVASQFSEPGGAYLYVRTAFGRFAGMQRTSFDVRYRADCRCKLAVGEAAACGFRAENTIGCSAPISSLIDSERQNWRSP